MKSCNAMTTHSDSCEFCSYWHICEYCCNSIKEKNTAMLEYLTEERFTELVYKVAEEDIKKRKKSYIYNRLGYEPAMFVVKERSLFRAIVKVMEYMDFNDYFLLIYQALYSEILNDGLTVRHIRDTGNVNFYTGDLIKKYVINVFKGWGDYYGTIQKAKIIK